MISNASLLEDKDVSKIPMSAISLQGKPGFRHYLSHLPWIFWVVALCGLIYSLRQGVDICGDAFGHLRMSPFYYPLYCLFLRAYLLFFSEGTWRPLFFIQIVLGMTGALFFVYALQRTFSWKKTRWVELFLFLLCISPNYVDCWPTWCGTLWSEALAYPLWLFAAGNIVIFFGESSFKACRRFFLLVGLLVLARRQFIFLYPVMVLFLIGLFTFLKSLVEKKQRWPLVLYTILSVGITDLAERGYRLVVHGAFATSPILGAQLIVAPVLFIGQQGVDYLQDPKEKAIYTEICTDMKKRIFRDCRGYLVSLNKTHSVFEYSYYHLYCFSSAFSRAKEKERGKYKNDIERLWATDKTLTRMAICLILHHPFTYLRYLGRTFLFAYFTPSRLSVGGFFLLFIGFFCLCIFFFQHIPSRYRILLGSAGVLFFANVFSLELVQCLCTRYTLYTDVFLGAIIIAIVAERKQKGEEERQVALPA
jgi:hypothetical protein